MVEKKNSLKNEKWYVGGLHFECAQCSGCCSGPGEGFIWVTRPEIQFIADFLKISVGELKKEYIERYGFRTTIIEHPSTKDCIFLRKVDGKKTCVIYPVRPNQCRTWPFWSSNLLTADDWNQAAQKCPGINRGRFYSFDEIEELRKQKKWWTDDR